MSCGSGDMVTSRSFTYFQAENKNKQSVLNGGGIMLSCRYLSPCWWKLWVAASFLWEQPAPQQLHCHFYQPGTGMRTFSKMCIPSMMPAGSLKMHLLTKTILLTTENCLSFAQFAPIPVSGLFPLSVKSHFVLERPRGLLNHASHFGCLGPWSQWEEEVLLVVKSGEKDWCRQHTIKLCGSSCSWVTTHQPA